VFSRFKTQPEPEKKGNRFDRNGQQNSRSQAFLAELADAIQHTADSST